MTAETTSAWHRFWHTRWRDLLRGRIDGRLDWRQLIAAEDLPANVRQLIHEVVRGTRLWRCEKVDVARELIAHFQDGLEAGASAEQLVSSFGDPRQAALLIRRAKRRGRSLAWQIWRVASLAFGALLIAYAGLALYYVIGRPTVKVDYLAVINARADAVPEDERAWPLYRQALQQMMVARKFPEWAESADLPPTSVMWLEAMAWLEEHEESLDLVREASTVPEMGFVLATSPRGFSPADQQLFFEPDNPGLDPRLETLQRPEDRMLISAHLPHLILLRSLARVMAIDARRAALAGDGETALDNVDAILGIAEHVQQAPCLIVTAVAAAIHGIAYETVEDVVSRRPDLWSAGQLRDLAHSIAAAKVNWRSGYEGERAIFYDMLQRFYTDNGHGDGHLAFRGPDGLNVFDAISRVTGAGPDNPFVYDSLAMALMPAANLYVASRKEAAETYDAALNDSLVKMEAPLWKLPPDPKSDADLASFGDPWNDARHFFVAIMVPAHDRLRKRLVEHDAERDGALIGLALQSYHQQFKQWPKSLAELSPARLPAVPIDRLTGKALGYKVVNDRPMVYSIGTGAEGHSASNPFEIDEKASVESTEDWELWSTAPRN